MAATTREEKVKAIMAFVNGDDFESQDKSALIEDILTIFIEDEGLDDLYQSMQLEDPS